MPLLVTYVLSELVLSDPGFMSIRVSNQASRTIDRPGKLDENIVLKVHSVVSPDIVLMGGYKTNVFAS
jgi:hypothetical protein